MPLRSSLTSHRRSAARLIRAFGRDREGATAVELALIAMPFFTLLCAIIETALVFWAGQILDTSLANATRTLYTGSFQGRNPSSNGAAQALTNLRNAMCYPNGDTSARANTTIFDCNAVKIDVLTSAQFSGPAPSPVDSRTGDWTNNFGTRYTTPNPGDVVTVQAAVRFPVFFSFMTPKNSSFQGNRILRATAAFRTEPYQ